MDRYTEVEKNYPSYVKFSFGQIISEINYKDEKGNYVHLYI